MSQEMKPKGRFAPSPSGRMHLGNMMTALLSWLDAKSRGGTWLLRIEDLDPQRSKTEFARLIEDDLRWLGLDWDEGGLDDLGSAGPYSQSLRHDIYTQYLSRLRQTGLTYPCHCRRTDIMATQAPHQTDGRIVYAGTCRPSARPPFPRIESDTPAATRIYVPDRVISFTDRIFGPQSVNLTEHCGDFVVERADGARAYQLAVVIDDALMGVTDVIRGCDLLLSTAQQLYLYEILGLRAPRYGHVPLVCNAQGLSLSKRDQSMSMEQLRRDLTPAQLTGILAHTAGLTPTPAPVAPHDLLDTFSLSRIAPTDSLVI